VDAGRLTIGGRAVDALMAEAGGSPLFVYDMGLIRRRIALFRAHLRRRSAPLRH
jgi:diaminopimelate decarboxylase